LTTNSQIGDFLDNPDKLAERAAYREDKYLQAVTKTREAAEKANDRETVVKLVELYEEIQDKIQDIDTQRRQKVIDSQIWALEKEIEIYGEAIEEVKALGCENE
jgi:tRNA A37 N6-isopentenylltransferase MiaA